MDWRTFALLALASCGGSPERPSASEGGSEAALEARLDACPAEHRGAIERLRASVPDAASLWDAAHYRAVIGDVHGALDVLALGRALWPGDEAIAGLERELAASPASAVRAQDYGYGEEE